MRGKDGAFIPPLSYFGCYLRFPWDSVCGWAEHTGSAQISSGSGQGSAAEACVLGRGNASCGASHFIPATALYKYL